MTGGLSNAVLLAVIALVPIVVLMMTSFVKISVVLSLLRNAIGAPDAPSGLVVMGLSLILTFFVMAPVAIDMVHAGASAPAPGVTPRVPAGAGAGSSAPAAGATGGPSSGRSAGSGASAAGGAGSGASAAGGAASGSGAGSMAGAAGGAASGSGAGSGTSAAGNAASGSGAGSAASVAGNAASGSGAGSTASAAGGGTLGRGAGSAANGAGGASGSGAGSAASATGNAASGSGAGSAASAPASSPAGPSASGAPDLESAMRELLPAQYQSQVDAFARGLGPLRGFLARHAGARDRETFTELARRMGHTVRGDELWVLAPAFVTTELREAFAIAVLIFVPFLVLDLVVGLGLASLGLVSTSPQTVALPLKLLLFVAVDGWRLLIDALLRGYV